MTIDQLFSLRPAPGFARYRTPVPGLYLSGAGTHPGGGVHGMPGKLAAAAVLGRRARGETAGQAVALGPGKDRLAIEKNVELNGRLSTMDPYQELTLYQRSAVLMAAAKLGIFAALADGAATPAEVAQKVSAPADTVARLLAALAALTVYFAGRRPLRAQQFFETVS